ncbi:agmatine deiminase family protein [Parathalassolituus penaei]|uniref:Agmatine deiminase family protein n=1 Tax=Parathalassolituus penaei TaxID=2997323 RepID=A0A9X3EFR5_9GAMM|nr:agmatine deiminase family protein [Parathalassolituus penaei]MCY0966431.1 agmatine deiminase family protein [Parathalassolituus penaei]
MNKRMPAEWEPQTAVQLIWPDRSSDWGASLGRVEPVYHAIVAAIAQYQKVIISVASRADQSRLAHLYQNQPMVSVWLADNNDTWARDTGPLSCYENGKLRLLDFRFNGWGNRYACDKDDRITATLHRAGAFGDVVMHRQEWILEGGSLETDGRNTLLTTESCLLNPNRNPGFTRLQIEQMLLEYLGIERVIWLTSGKLEGDDTDGHIDTLARFCNPHTIAYCQARHSDSHYASLKAMETQLQGLRQPNGAPYNLMPLPLPSPIHNSEGKRLPATYANFLIINKAVLVPVYDVPEDSIAIERLMQSFPSHRIHPINCRALIEQFGSLHCLTMQIHQETDHGRR